MKFLLLVAVFGLLLFGCTAKPTASPTAAAASPVASATVMATATATPVPTAAATAVPSPSASAVAAASASVAASVKASASVSASVKASASPSASVSAGKSLKEVADAIQLLTSSYFKSSAQVYQPDYDTYAVTDFTSKYRFDFFVRKAIYRWSPDDLLSNVTSANGKSMLGEVIINPSSSFYGYDFKFICFNNSVIVEGKTRDYFFDPAKGSSLGKVFAGMVVDLCAG